MIATDDPGTPGLPNAQTGNPSSDGPTRTIRAGEPPGSGSSKASRIAVDRPLASRLASWIVSSVEVTERDATPTATLTPFSVARKPVDPGRTARFTRS